MATADITTPDGTVIKVEGTAAEIAAVLADIKANAQSGRPTGRKKQVKVATRGRATRLSLPDLLEELLADGFFKVPRDFASIRSELATRGHHYARTALSPTLLRLVRRRSLRRVKEDKRWLYTT